MVSVWGGQVPRCIPIFWCCRVRLGSARSCYWWPRTPQLCTGEVLIFFLVLKRYLLLPVTFSSPL